MGLCASSLEDQPPDLYTTPHYRFQPPSTPSTFPPTYPHPFSSCFSSASASRRPPPDLPPECIALVLSHLPPASICRLASVSKSWAAAADSDTCWNRLLPHSFQTQLAPRLFLDPKQCLGPNLAQFPKLKLSPGSSLELAHPSSASASSASPSVSGGSSVSPQESQSLPPHLPKFDPLRPDSTNLASLRPGSTNLGTVASIGQKRPSGKVLFQALCRGVLLEGGRLKVKVDPGTGLISVAVTASEAMGIAWGSDSSYWHQMERKGSVFPRVSHLAAVSAFDLIGRFTIPLPVRSCRYELWWRVARDPTLGETWMPRDVVFEWPCALVTSNVKVTGLGLSESVEIQRRVVFNDVTLSGAGWTEVGVGMVVLWPGERGGEFVETEWEVRLCEVESGMWKSGLYVDCFMLREAPM